MTDTTINSEEHLDVIFKLRGAPIPLDNGYVIYSALCRICPTLHELQEVGIHPIAGIPTHNNFLELTPNSCLKIRIHHLQLPLIYPYLTGQTFEIGQESYQLNIPDYQAIRSSDSLYSRFGCLFLGESDQLIKVIRLVSEDYKEGVRRWLIRDNRGRLTLPYWVDHVGSKNTRFLRYRVAEMSQLSSPDLAWTRIQSPV